MRSPWAWAMVVVAWTTLSAGPAPARTVLCFGDSTSWTYPARLAALRPDLAVRSGAKPGDVSTSFARLAGLVAQHRPDDVVIMIGTNDVARGRDGRSVVTADPRVTFRNVRRLARLARDLRAHVLVLTQTPASCPALCAERQRHTREVAHRLVAWGLARAASR